MKNKILLILIVFLFLITSSFEIARFIVDYKYNKASGLTFQLDEIINTTTDNNTKEQLILLNEEIKFINEGCFK